MVYSMTAFTREESSSDCGVMTLELRSVNHRYLEISARIPEELRSLETKFRQIISNKLKRGKLDYSLRYQPPEASQNNLQVNQALAKQILQACQEIDTFIEHPAPLKSLEILQWPGVLQSPKTDAEQLTHQASSLFEKALDSLCATRAREGEKLAAFIMQRCTSMQAAVEEVRQLLPDILASLRTRLTERLVQLQTELDTQRLEQEMAYLAQKMDVHEEIDRLCTHIDEVERVLKEEHPAGRRLDFLMQELNREANTLGSKSVDTQTSRASVDLKVLIEQIREQVQNIE